MWGVNIIMIVVKLTLAPTLKYHCLVISEVAYALLSFKYSLKVGFTLYINLLILNPCTVELSINGTIAVLTNWATNILMIVFRVSSVTVKCYSNLLNFLINIFNTTLVTRMVKVTPKVIKFWIIIVLDGYLHGSESLNDQ